MLENGGISPSQRKRISNSHANNQPIICPPGSGNTCTRRPGRLSTHFTNALTTGGTLQATNDDKILGHNNYFIIGGSIDHSTIASRRTANWLRLPQSVVGPNAAVPGTGQIIHDRRDLGFSPSVSMHRTRIMASTRAC